MQGPGQGFEATLCVRLVGPGPTGLGAAHTCSTRGGTVLAAAFGARRSGPPQGPRGGPHPIGWARDLPLGPAQPQKQPARRVCARTWIQYLGGGVVECCVIRGKSWWTSCLRVFCPLGKYEYSPNGAKNLDPAFGWGGAEHCVIKGKSWWTSCLRICCPIGKALVLSQGGKEIGSSIWLVGG